jgi:hypothetical protein
MTLVTRFQGIKDSLQRLPKDFGIATYQKDLIVRRFVRLVPSGTSVEDLVIEPTPKIYNVPERLFNLPLAGGTITLSAEDIMVENVSRSYSKETFTNDVDYFMLEGEKYRLIHISDQKSLGWRLILQHYYDREE